ncbi:MAG: pectate lyase [Luteimonas sp.]|nr:pectate lyase [Luteimonas sp.]
MRAGYRIVLCALLFAGSAHAAGEAAHVIPLDGFKDGIHHWQNLHGSDYPRHAPEDYVRIADNILLYQRRDGGWVENRDPARIIPDEERDSIRADASKAGGSFDNRNVYTQVEYLAEAFALGGDARYRDAALKGLDFILAHQSDGCGAWPHTVPATTRYHPLLTIADEVTSGVLSTLRRAMSGGAPFDFLDHEALARIQVAVARGDACLLALQVRQGDARTGWAGQYDPKTLSPSQGRSFELPSIAVQETVEVVRYLMSIPDPSPEVVEAVEGAVAWLDAVQIDGVRLETFEAEPEQYRFHRTTLDRRLVEDPAAPPLWARFYDAADNSIVLATREGVRVTDYADIPRERRTGYDWFGGWPRTLLSKDYPHWKSRSGEGAGAAEGAPAGRAAVAAGIPAVVR